MAKGGKLGTNQGLPPLVLSSDPRAKEADRSPGKLTMNTNIGVGLHSSEPRSSDEKV